MIFCRVPLERQAAYHWKKKSLPLQLTQPAQPAQPAQPTQPASPAGPASPASEPRQPARRASPASQPSQPSPASPASPARQNATAPQRYFFFAVAARATGGRTALPLVLFFRGCRSSGRRHRRSLCEEKKSKTGYKKERPKSVLNLPCISYAYTQ